MTRRNTAAVIFVTLCVILVAAAVTLNIGWILVNGRRVLPLVLGIIAFALIIGGIIVYTVFLVRELRRNDQHDAFINAVTHELKTPIASIRLYLANLQARELNETQLKAGVAGQRVGMQQRTPVDMAALVHEVTETVRLRHHLAPDQVTVSLATPAATALFVNGDAEELRTVVSNLLDNAVKYSRETVQIAVEVAAPSPDTVWVRVRDRGIGIPRAQLKRIFKRFYRFQTRGFTVKGTGLGLYIVRSIVKQHGGRVFAASEGEGKGATFTVELPRLVRT
jgi:two-component system, OmpR family, sensor histidine kinase SenX3